MAVSLAPRFLVLLVALAAGGGPSRLTQSRVLRGGQREEEGSGTESVRRAWLSHAPAQRSSAHHTT